MSEITKFGGISRGNAKIVHDAALKLAIAFGCTPEEIEYKVYAEASRREFRNNLPKAYILKSIYDEMSEEHIKSIEAKNEYILVPVEEEELERLKQNAVPYTMPLTMSKTPEIQFLEPCVSVGRIGSGKTPKIFPKDYAKKLKKKQRIQKQSRKKHK